MAVDELKPDILAINETWLGEGEEDKAPQVPGYRLRFCPRPAHIRGGRGGGVGFYIRKGIVARSCPHPTTHSVEQMWTRVKVKGRELIVGTAYRPPWQDPNQVLEALTESITSFSRYDYLVLVGDLNLDILTPDSSKTKLLLQFLYSLNLTQTVSEPTHFTNHSATLIDIVCTDARVRKTVVKYSPDLGHHAMLQVELDIKKEKHIPRLVTYRPLRNIILEQFASDLNSINWEYFIETTDVNILVPAFSNIVLKLFDLHAPLKTTKFKDPPQPWLTDTVKSMIKIRDNYHTKYRALKSNSLRTCYKEMKHLVIAAIISEKKAYFKEHINNNVKNPKKLWKNLKHTILPNKKGSELPPTFNDPDLINSHFLNVPGEKHVSISQLSFYEHHRHCSGNMFSLVPVSEDIVMTVIRGLKSNAMGVDGISIEMIFMTLPESLKAITSIINKSITSGTFPEQWKVALVKPIPKNNNPISCNDLRPISLLPCMSKILEKVVSLQLTKFLEDKNILPNVQSGFRKGHSTSTALLDVVDSLLAGQDCGMISILVLLDFSRAFDSINTSLLISKLSYYGFDMQTVKWFHSYLKNRYQLVQLSNGTRSTLQPVPQGVPQGSILGPILFILYSSDIIRAINHCNFHLYADDLQLYISTHTSNLDIAVEKMNSDLCRISDWSRNNSLVINPQKSKYMFIGTRQKLQNLQNYTANISVDGALVERVSEAKNLGLTMDSSLHFEKHVSESVRNCFYRLRLLYKIRSYLSESVRITLCESLVLSKLNYCDTVYGPCLLSRTTKLIQRVQNACARFCFHVPPRSHITPFLNSSNLLKMEARRKLHLASLLFGVIAEQRPKYLFEKLTWARSNSKYPRRMCTPIFETPHHKSTAFRGSFKFAASKCWNIIPPPMRAVKNVYMFRKVLKKQLLCDQLNSQ